MNPSEFSKIFTGKQYFALNEHKVTDPADSVEGSGVENLFHQGTVVLQFVSSDAKNESRRYIIEDAFKLGKVMERLKEQGKHVEMHEAVMTGCRQKPRLDLDMKVEEGGSEDAAEKIVAAFSTFFKELYGLEQFPAVDIYDSSDDSKISKHVIVREYCWRDHFEAKEFHARFIKVLDSGLAKFIDDKIYSKTSHLRILYSTKNGTTRRKVSYESDRADCKRKWQYADSLITYTEHCALLPVLAANVDAGVFAAQTPVTVDGPNGPQIAEFMAKHSLAPHKASHTTTGGPLYVRRTTACKCPVHNRVHDNTTSSCGLFSNTKTGLVFICLRPNNGETTNRVIIVKRDSKTMWTRLEDSRHEFNDVGTASIKTVGAVIKANVAFVRRGGKPIYITRNIINSEIIFTMTSAMNLREDPKKWVIEGEKKPLTLLKAIENQVDNISFKQVDFMPDHEGPRDGVFNMFTGFRHKVMDDFSPEIVAPAEEHIKKVWCSGNINHYKYVKAWFAHLVQKPAQKRDTFIYLKSKQGSGKGVIAEFIGKKVIGEKYFAYCENMEELFEKFNAKYENKLFTFIDEATTSDHPARDTTQRLKALITKTTTSVERKGVDKVETRDHNNYFMASNENLGLRPECDDRRGVFIEASDEYKDDKDYFVRLTDALNDECGKHFFTMLMKYDISDFNPRKLPEMAAKKYMIEESLPPTKRFIIQYARDNCGKDLNIIAAELFGEYEKWCETGHIRPASNIIFGRDLSKILESKPGRLPNGKSVRFYRAPWVDFAAAIKKETGLDIDFAEGEELNPVATTPETDDILDRL